MHVHFQRADWGMKLQVENTMKIGFAY